MLAKKIKNSTFYRFDFIIVEGAEKETRMSDKIPSEELLINNMRQQKDTLDISDLVKLLDMVMHTKYSIDYLPNQLKNKRRKKKRKGLSKIEKVIHPYKSFLTQIRHYQQLKMTSIFVPLPNLLVIANSACAKRARSCIFFKPIPSFSLVATSKPLPLSSISSNCFLFQKHFYCIFTTSKLSLKKTKSL